MSPRFALACLALSLLATPRACADAPSPPDLPIEAYRLSNGLKVVLHRDPTVPRVTVCVAYHVGSKDERAGRTGFAHFFEHMMFRGTKNVPNYDIPLQETGGQSNAFTTEDLTVYHETIPTEYLGRALYLEAERLAFLSSGIDREKFDTEREVVKNERRQSYENVPYGLAEEAILANIFPKGHPYSWSVIGSMGDLNAASVDDLRRFFREFYEPSNACLCLAGDFDPAIAKAEIVRYFGPLAPGRQAPRVKPAPAAPRAGRLILPDRVSLPRVYFAWPSVADDDPDAPALDLLADVLTDGDASRLHRALVLDAKVAKDVSARSDTKEVAGLFTIEATATEGMTADKVESALDVGLARLRSAPPTADEFARALAKFEKSTYARLTSSTSRAFTLAAGFLEKDDPAYYRRDIARYFRVTPADLARVASKYLVADRFVLQVVPIEKGGAKAKALAAGPASSTTPTPDVPERSPAPGPDWARLPGPGKAPSYKPPSFVRRRLSTGLEVWIAPWKTLPIVVGRLIVPLGTADDPEGKAGLAELTAALLTQGTGAKTATETAEALDLLGVSYSCSADLDETSLSFNVLTRNLEPALAILAPMFTQPRLDRTDFDRERGLHLANLTQGPDRINWLTQRALRALLYGQNHPYGQPGDGFVKTVEAIRPDDVRAFAGRFAADRSKLIVAGDVEPDALMKVIESTLGSWKTRGPAPSARPGPIRKHDAGTIYLVDKPGAVQSNLRIARPWIDRRDPTYYAATIGNHVFGVDFLSRLNANLREKNGYTYGAQSMFLYRRDAGLWLSAASVRADATAPALGEMIRELNEVGGKNVLSPAEIELGRNALIRSFPEMYEDPGSIVGTLETIAVYGLPDDYLATFISRVEAVPAPEVAATFRRLASPEERVVLVVGDRKAIEPGLLALKIGPIRIITSDGKPPAR